MTRTYNVLHLVRHFWFQHLTAAALAVKGAATTDEVFAILPAAPLWPYVLFAVAATILASTLAPFNAGLQAFTGAILMSVAGLRIASYLTVLTIGHLTGRAVALAWYLIALWLVVFAVGAAWPRLARDAGLDATVHAGRATDEP